MGPKKEKWALTACVSVYELGRPLTLTAKSEARVRDASIAAKGGGREEVCAVHPRPLTERRIAQKRGENAVERGSAQLRRHVRKRRRAIRHRLFALYGPGPAKVEARACCIAHNLGNGNDSGCGEHVSSHADKAHVKRHTRAHMSREFLLRAAKRKKTSLFILWEKEAHMVLCGRKLWPAELSDLLELKVGSDGCNRAAERGVAPPPPPLRCLLFLSEQREDETVASARGVREQHRPTSGVPPPSPLTPQTPSVYRLSHYTCIPVQKYSESFE
eukprot:scaffold243025_cov33-Tisochrysis_lutea.AAC.4